MATRNPKHVLQIKLDVVGSKKVLRKFQKLDYLVQKKAVRKGLRRGAKQVLADAKRLVPVETGRLKQSGKARATRRSRTGFGVIVIFDERQAFAIETGTARHPPQPYMRPAIRKNYRFTLLAVRDEINKAIAEVARG